MTADLTGTFPKPGCLDGHCLCVFSSHLLAVVPLFKVKRALHFAVYLEDYTRSVYFSVQLEPTGVTQEWVNTGAFFFFLCFLFAPPSSCGAWLHFFIAKRLRLSLSLVNTKVEFCLLTKSFSAINRFPLPGTTVRKKPTLAEIQTRDLVARRLRGYQLDHRGDRL